MIEFKLTRDEFIALCDLLKLTGLCENGGMAKSVIAEGLVTVDGAVELRKRAKIIKGQKVSFNQETILVN
jgi:ribosome-associated protein